MRRLACALLLAAACGDGEPVSPPPAKPPEEAPSAGADRMKYDQILVAFRGSYAKSGTGRSREEARALAYGILERVRAGFDFEALKGEYSDDRSKAGVALGPYETVRDGLPPRGTEIPRSKLYQGIGDVVFRLEVGEVGIADFHESRCPIGWIVLKRVE
jgi:hypothetical protein